MSKRDNQSFVDWAAVAFAAIAPAAVLSLLAAVN
ncbi:hypothetical protein F0521_25470 [Ferrimonas sp. YFM]|nr:hypothetical protein F0521_25470 [Ferrimonas sp. YFM]